MKSPLKILLGSLLFTGLQFGLTSCVTDGYVGVDTGVYYGPHYGDPWFHDGGWLDGNRGYGEVRSGGHGAYIHPPQFHGHAAAPAAHAAASPERHR